MSDREPSCLQTVFFFFFLFFSLNCVHLTDPGIGQYHVEWFPEVCTHNESARLEASSAVTQVRRRRPEVGVLGGS